MLIDTRDTAQAAAANHSQLGEGAVSPSAILQVFLAAAIGFD